MLRIRFSRLQMHVFAHTAGVILMRPPARAFWLVLLIHKLAQKTDFGEIQSLAMLRTRPSRWQEHIFAHTAGIIFVHTAGIIFARPPARAFCLVL